MTDASTPLEAPRRKRRRRDKSNGEYAAFAERIIDGMGRRAAAGDLDALAALAGLRDVLEGNLIDAISGQRHAEVPQSWSRIAFALGQHRQAVERKYAAKIGGRMRRGAQPAAWRLPPATDDDLHPDA